MSKSYGVLVRDGRSWAWLGEGRALTLNTVKALRWPTSLDALEAAQSVAAEDDYKIAPLNGRY